MKHCSGTNGRAMNVGSDARARVSFTLCPLLFTHHAIVVGVVHVLVRGVSAVDRCDAVATGLCAGDAAVPVVVPEG